MSQYDGKQVVGIDLHRQRSVIVRQTDTGEQLSAVRIVNDPASLALQLEKTGEHPKVVLETTYGWYWAIDALQAAGASVHLAHPLGVKGFRYPRVKNDVRDAGDLADLLRMNRLPEAWIAPPATRELRDLVRYRAKLVAIRSGLKAQVHSVLAKEGLLVPLSDLFRVDGRRRLAKVPLGTAYAQRVISLLELIDVLDTHERRFTTAIADQLRGHVGYRIIQQLPGVGPVLGAVFVAEIGDAHRFPGPGPRPTVFVGRTDPTPSRVRHRRAAWTHHQAGQQTGPLGGGRGHRAPTCRYEDLSRPCTHRGPSRQEHRQGRRSPQAAHPRLLRATRRTYPRTGPPAGGGVSTPDATRARPPICLTPASRRGRALD
jgi:transposase